MVFCPRSQGPLREHDLLQVQDLAGDLRRRHLQAYRATDQAEPVVTAGRTQRDHRIVELRIEAAVHIGFDHDGHFTHVIRCRVRTADTAATARHVNRSRGPR